MRMKVGGDMISRLRSMLAQRHTVRAHFWQSLANYTQTGGGMLLGIILARMLQPEVFGKFALINASLLMLMVPFSFSASQLLVSDAGKTSGLFSRVMGMAWIIFGLKCVALMIFWMVQWLRADIETIWVSLLVGIPLVCGDLIGVVRADLEGRGMFKPNFKVQLGGMLSHTAVSVSLVLAGCGIYGLAAGLFAAFLPQLLIYLKNTDRNLMQIQLDRQIFAEQFRVGFWLWLNQIAESWSARLDKLFLGKFGGNTELGYYNRAFNYGPISHLALNSFMTSATVRGIAMQEERKPMLRLIGKTSLLVVTGAVLNFILWWFFADPLVPLIFGSHWRDAIPVFETFAGLSLAYAIAYLPCAVLLAFKDFMTLALCRIVGLAVMGVVLGVMILNSSRVTASDVAIVFCGMLLLTGMLMLVRAIRLLQRIPV